MQNTMTQEELFKKLVAHCKEYGFVFPSSEIYDGLGAVYDYGQNGVELKNNIKRYWWDSMVKLHENIVGIDAAAGVITSKNDPSQTRSNPNFTASKEESGAYGMEVSSPTLMVVVVDQTTRLTPIRNRRSTSTASP